MPDAVGVPEMVMTLFAHEAVTPDGSPIGAPIPVAPVVAMVKGCEPGQQLPAPETG